MLDPEELKSEAAKAVSALYVCVTSPFGTQTVHDAGELLALSGCEGEVPLSGEESICLARGELDSGIQLKSKTKAKVLSGCCERGMEIRGKTLAAM